MSEIEDLERRLSAAMDRIATGLDKMGAAQGGSADAEIAVLKETLEAQKAENARLKAELEALSAVAGSGDGGSGDVSGELAALRMRHTEEVTALKDAAAEERAAWEGLNSRLVRMRRSNKLLRTNTLALRQAMAENVSDAELINQSLVTELDALNAAYDVDRAETDAILKTLHPLLDEAGDELEGGADA